MKIDGAVPNITEMANRAKTEAQQMELQLRIIAVQTAMAAAKPGEPVKDTMERVGALSGYLFSGVVK